MRLTILTVNYNTADFIELILYSIEKLCYYPADILIADNGSKPDDLRKLKKLASGNPAITLYTLNHSLKGSYAHGYALDYLCARVNSLYFVVLDSDALFLIAQWDRILIEKLKGKIKVIGTEGADNKPKDFPLMYAAIFETATFRDLDISFKPIDIKAGQDTGWELRIKYTSAGYRGEKLYYKNTKYYKEGPFKDVICGEYYLQDNKSIIASHFYRGATLGADKYLQGRIKQIYRIPLIGKFLLKQKGLGEKRKWIETCRQIVDFQSEKNGLSAQREHLSRNTID